MSSAAVSVRGFTEFDFLCRGNKGYSDNLAQLFDVCENDQTLRQKISYKQAQKRLRNKIKDSLNSIENESSRKVTEFTIGKTYVKELKKTSFDPMKRTTWKLGDGINKRWKFYQKKGYDGLVVIGCVEKNLIPDDVMQDNTSIKMNQQQYALGLEQSLIHYYRLHKPDPRLGNESFNPGSTSKIVYRGGIVYVAYKLEQETNLDNLKDDDDERTKEKRTAERTAQDSTEMDEVNIGLCQLQLDRLSDQDSTSDVKISKAQKIN